MIDYPISGCLSKRIKIGILNDIRIHLSITGLFCDVEDVEGGDMEQPKHPTASDCQKKFSVFSRCNIIQPQQSGMYLTQ